VALQLLRWVCDPRTDNPLRVALGSSLATLAAAPGPEGLLVASTWLGELLVHLSLDVRAYNSLRPV
jgi:hypothetical protein